MTNRLYGNQSWDTILNETYNNIAKLCKTKGDEYAASDDDQLANFRRRAERLGLPMEAVWGIYAGKHWDALETYIKDLTGGRSRERSEPLGGRVDDIIVYLILFKAMLAERESIAAKPATCGVCRLPVRHDCLRSGCPHSTAAQGIDFGRKD